MRRRWFVLVGGAVLFAGAAARAAGPPVPRIAGGQEAEPCQWPTTALLTAAGSLCSAVLIHARLVVTAAHCIDPDEPPFDVKFGERHYEPERKVPIERCQRSPNYDGTVGGTDIAFCTLQEAVEDIPPTPVVYGCETTIIQFGWPVTIVGYGRPDDEEQAGTKRFADTMIQSWPDEESTVVIVGAPGSSACNGDSGGPAYVQYPTDDSWHVVGIVSGGYPGCGFSAKTYVLIHPWIPWMEIASGLDLTPCHDRDGTWNPTDRCGRFAVDPRQQAVDWTDWCASALSGPSDTCGEPFAGPLYDPRPEPEEDAGCGCRVGASPRSGIAGLAVGLLRRRRARF